MLVLLVIGVLLIAMVTPSETVPLWGLWEGRFSAAGDADPATGVTVEFRSPGGRTQPVRGFWDGGREWKVRFMPDKEGEWRWRTGSEPAVEGVAGRAGAFRCTLQPGDNRFLRHGPVRVSAEGTHFEHADGTPFFWLGDTAWTGPQLSSAEDWAAYLRDRVSKRFTAVQFVLTAPWRTARADAEGQVSFTGRESISIQPGYFQRMDQRVAAVNRAGLLAVPVMLWALGDNDPGRWLPEDQAIRLARYLLARYGAHHVAWILPGDGRYEGEFAERWKRIGRAVFGDTEHAPVTLHPGGMMWPYDAFRDEGWLGFVGYQSGHGDDAEAVRWIHSGPPARGWREARRLPRINLEPPYEDHLAYQSRQPHSAYNVRRAAYYSLLNAPTAGLTYGAHGIWSWQTQPGLPADHESTGVARPWREAKDLPGGVQMGYLADLFRSLPWWRLRPDPEILREQPGGDDPMRFVAAARTEDDEYRVVYLPAGGEVRVAGEEAVWKAEWFDPRTGEWSSTEATFPHTFRAPDGRDWVLVMRRSDEEALP